MLKHPLKVGFSFGITSGIITTLGLMVGLHAGTGSRLAVIGGILTIAIADAFSDALGIHISEESEDKHTPKQIWVATFATFFSKFIFALSFIVPILIFKLALAVKVGIAWGLGMLCMFSYRMAREQNKNPLKVVSEHLAIAFMVLVITYAVGHWVSRVFG